MNTPELLLGTAYYPEQTPEDEWERDAELMRELGLNAVRVGEFCWSRLQRSNGDYTLDWLKNFLDLFQQYELNVFLCTPTATPPVWMNERFPDLACLTPDGRRGEFGGRRHYSAFHPGYRDCCRALAERLALHFGRHPAVTGWQIDNEVGTYSTLDCSPPARHAFHDWLKQNGWTPEKINQAWGLIFWNQEIERLDQIPAPTEMLTTRSPQHILAYNRFCLEGLADFILLQADAMRPHLPADQVLAASTIEPVAQTLFRKQQERGSAPVNAFALNRYPELNPDYQESAMHLDRLRALPGSPRIYCLELQTGSGHSTTGALDAAPRRFWALETLAAGVQSLFWFHWRRFRTGCEWRLAAILERDRQPRDTWHDLQRLIAEIRELAPILHQARPCPDVNILLSLDNILARDRASESSFWLEIQLPEAWRHRFPLWEKETRRAAYTPLTRLGFSPGFLAETENVWPTDIPLIATDLDLCTADTVEKIRQFCEQGGTFICFPGAGDRDNHGAHRELPPPGILGPLIGVELLDYCRLPADCGTAFDHQAGTAARTGEQKTAQLDVDWIAAAPTAVAIRLNVDPRHAERLTPLADDVEILGRYASGPHQGDTAMVRRKLGHGQIIYLGAVPLTPNDAMQLYRRLLPAPAGLTVGVLRPYRFQSRETEYCFLFNETAESQPLTPPVYDRISQKTINCLPPFDLALITNRPPERELRSRHEKTGK